MVGKVVPPRGDALMPVQDIEDIADRVERLEEDYESLVELLHGIRESLDILMLKLAAVSTPDVERH